MQNNLSLPFMVFSRLTIILKSFMLLFMFLFECLLLILEVSLLMPLKNKQASENFYFYEAMYEDSTCGFL